MAEPVVTPIVGLGLVVAFGVATTAGVLLLARRDDGPGAAPKPAPARGPAGPAQVDFSKEEEPIVGDAASAQLNVEALGRMLVSEDRRPSIQTVIGWTTMQKAERRGISVYRLLTGKSGRWGPQVFAGETRYASTAKAATPETLALADKLLSGHVLPSAPFRALGPVAWVEQDVGGYTALRILQKQTYQKTTRLHKKGALDFGGLVGRLTGSKWYLYSARADAVPTPATEEEAALVLAALPEIPPVDFEPVRGNAPMV